MFLTITTKMTNILFEGWSTHTSKDVVLASFLTFLFTFGFEGLKVVKTVVVSKQRVNPLVPRDEPAVEYETTEPQVELLASLRIPSSLSEIKRQKITLFAVECLLHMVTFTYGYFIMLVVMSYSVWLLLAVLVGSVIGYGVCYPIGQHFVTDKVAKHNCQGDDGIVQSRDPDVSPWI